MNRAHVFVPLVPMVTVIAGCVTRPEFRPEAVEAYEYRHFSEYGGYFPIQPITSRGRTGIVRADWVVPVKGPDGKPDYTPPASREEAERRVSRTGKQERQLPPGLAIPAGVALGPAIYALEGTMVLAQAPVSQASRQQTEKSLGVHITIRATDPDGRPIPGARVWECPSLMVYPVYTDTAGRRSFAPPRRQVYEISSNAADLLADHLPIHLGRDSSSIAADTAGLTDRFAKQAGVNGEINYTSIALARVHNDPEAGGASAWLTPLPALQLFLLVWAPGYKPAVLTTPAVRAKDQLSLAVALQPLSDCARIAQAAGDLENVPERLRKAIHPTMWTRYDSKVEEPLLKALLRDLEQWARDETLPGYLRWNAVDFLQRLTWQLPGKERALHEEVKAALARPEAAGAKLSPYLSDGALNPWRALSEAEMLFRRLSETGLGAGLASQARTVLAEGEAALPGLPLWEQLRAVVALAEGDRERATALARGLNHPPFFRLFYGLEIQPQRVGGGLGE